MVTYLLVYAAMNLGAFAVVIAVARKTRSGEIRRSAGSSPTRPASAVAMTFFLFSLAGTPPLAGWVAKFIVFRRCSTPAEAGPSRLAVIGAVNSVIALFYYAAVAKEMWMNPAPDGDASPLRIPGPLLITASGPRRRTSCSSASSRRSSCTSATSPRCAAGS